MPPRVPKPVIVRDTREKKPWDFSKDDKFEGQIDATLKTGDYSIEGYEDVIVVERKKSPNELIANFTTDKERIYKEIERLKSFKFAAIVIECNLAELLNPDNYVIASKGRWKNKMAVPAIVIKSLLDIMVKHGIMVIFAGRKGQGITSGLLREAYKVHRC
jgi:DNA-directed RNA polymerase beta subunit